jgi:hypothetical protein
MKLIAFLVQSRLWVALAAAGLTYRCYGLFDEWVRITMVMHVFFLTWTAYLFIDDQFTDRRRWLMRIAQTGLLVTWQGTESLWMCLPVAAVALLYRLHWLPDYPRLQRFELRRIPLLNNALIALCWIVICYLRPLSIAQIPLHQMAFFVVGDFCWIMALSMCEDLMHDSQTPDATARALGEKWLRFVAALLIGAAAVFHRFSERDLYATHFTALAALVIVVGMRAGQRTLFKSLLVDGVIVLRTFL